LDADIAAARAENAALLEAIRRLQAEKAALAARIALPPAAVPAAPPVSSSPAQGGTSSGDDGVRLRKDLADAESRLRSLADDNRRLNNEVKVSIVEIGTLRRQLEILKSQAANTDASKADEASRKRIAELEAMLAAVRATGDRSDTEIRNQSDISRREAEELKKRLAEASAELARLRVQPRATPFETRAQSDLRADQEQLLTENSRLAATARTQGETLAGLRSQLAAAERSLATAREQAAAEKAALQAAIDRLTADNQRLSSAVPAPASADGAGKDAATRELAALQTQLKTLAAEHEIALRKNSDEVSALNTQLKRVRDANRVLAETNKALLEAKAAE
ncbi:MAG TPA: hypothetical protein VIO38_09855, partial [Rariglobus sp.]